MEETTNDRDLVCVLFPGVVKNEEKAIQCLGGIRGISQVYSQPKKKRLGLTFQPENPFVKKLFGDCQNTSGLLLKVKVKKKKVDNEVKREVVSTSVLGRVNKIYKFESMCDFQYLPVHKEGTGPPHCILEQLLPTGLNLPSFTAGEAPLFIVPASFTRSDKPVRYAYTDKRYGEKKLEPSSDAEDDIVHRRRRNTRGKPSTRFDFNLIDDFPSEPHEYFLEQKALKAKTHPDIEKEFETVKKMFEERPIWSLNLIRYITKYKLISMKIVLPCLAVYMKNGPWRMTWVRFGFDPRKEPSARIYQTLDFRLRHQAGLHSMVMTRDSAVHYKKSDKVRRYQKYSVEPLLSEEISEGAVYFKPDIMPSQRQIFYQYCDVKIPEVEAIISLEPPPGYLCHHKRGWLPPNTDEQCRDHIFQYVRKAFLSTNNAELKLDQGDSSDEGSNSEDDGDSSSSE